MRETLISTAVLLGVSAVMYWLLQVRPRRIRQRVLTASAPELTCADVAARAAGGYVGNTRGDAQPGPAGVFRAPLSGVDCVWAYRRTARRVQLSEYLVQDFGGWGEGTTAPFRLTDTTGELWVDPTGLVPESCIPRAGVGRRFEDRNPAQALHYAQRFTAHPQPQPGPDGTELGTVEEEWTVTPFMRVYVPGTVSWTDGRAVVHGPAPQPALNGAAFAVGRLSPAQRAEGERQLAGVMKWAKYLPGVSSR